MVRLAGAAAYRKGRTFEHTVRRGLERHGWTVLRVAGSKGAVDLVALRPGRIAFIQCRRGGGISVRERDDLAQFSTGTSRPETYVVRVSGRRLEVRDIVLWREGWQGFPDVF